VGTSKNLRQATGDEAKVANKTIDGLKSVPSDSNDKGVAAMLDDTNKCHTIWRR